MAEPARPRPTCAICIEDIYDNQDVSTLGCGHKYHKVCLQPWLDSNHNTCPQDRRVIQSINGVLVREEREAAIEEYHPLEAARALYRQILADEHSADPLERQAAKVRAAAFRYLFG